MFPPFFSNQFSKPSSAHAHSLSSLGMPNDSWPKNGRGGFLGPKNVPNAKFLHILNAPDPLYNGSKNGASKLPPSKNSL